MCNKFERIVIKTSTVATEVATIPPNDNHQDSGWSATDIYKSELFVNRVDGRMFTRMDSGIVEIEITNAASVKGVIDQTTNNPPVFTGKDGIGIGGAEFSYVTTGSYLLTKTGAFPVGTVIKIGTGRALAERIIAYRVDDDNLAIKTGNPTAADDVLTNTAFEIYKP